MGVQIQEIHVQIDGFKSQLNDKRIRLEKNMPHLRSVDKGAFLLLREGVTSPIRANYMVNFTPKINKIQELTRVSPPGPPPGRCPGPTGGLKAAPRPHAFKKKSTPTRIP